MAATSAGFLSRSARVMRTAYGRAIPPRQQTNNGNQWKRTRRRRRRPGRGPARGERGRDSPVLGGVPGGVIPPGDYLVSVIMTVPTVVFVASLVRLSPPSRRLREYGSTNRGWVTRILIRPISFRPR